MANTNRKKLAHQVNSAVCLLLLIHPCRACYMQFALLWVDECEKEKAQASQCTFIFPFHCSLLISISSKHTFSLLRVMAAVLILNATIYNSTPENHIRVMSLETKCPCHTFVWSRWGYQTNLEYLSDTESKQVWYLVMSPHSSLP